MMQATHAAVFFVRAWWDEGRFRARITYCLDLDLDHSQDTQIATADTHEVGEQLARWLATAVRLHSQ